MIGWQRFALHVLVVAGLGPIAGAAIYSFVKADWNDSSLIGRLIGSLFGGVLLVTFIAPVTLGVGIATSVICWFARELNDPVNTATWSLVAAVAGALYGQMWSTFFAHGDRTLLVLSGAVVGLGTGALLAAIWRH